MSKKSLKIVSKILLSVLIILLIFFLIFYLWWFNEKRNELPKNSFLGDLDISFYQKDDLKDLIKQKEGEFREEGLSFVYQGDKKTLSLNLSGATHDIPDPDLLYIDSIGINQEKTLDNIKSNTFISYLKSNLLKQRTDYHYYYNYNLSNIKEWVLVNFPELFIEPESAYFSLKSNGTDKNLIINQEKIGRDLNLNILEKDLVKILSSLVNQDIVLNTKTTYPDIKRDDLILIEAEVLNLVPEDGLTLSFFESKKFNDELIPSVLNPRNLPLSKLIDELDLEIINNEININQTTLLTWVSLDQNLQTSFSEEKIYSYLKTFINPLVQKEVILTKLEIVDEKVVDWQVGSDGRKMDLDKVVLDIKNTLLSQNNKLEVLLNIIDLNDLDGENNFKIKELIGTGHSNFAGSPFNRRHNIKIGTEALDGLLIEPGEEFSLVKYLGDIDAAAGYLPELTIKGDKTVPEYGGGLCQVATTIFRSALGTGLPITARRNHSYRVSYYEPAGMDASVYDPWPDVKFINDTGNYILIQGRIEGNDMYFDFWGTSDGRVATTTKPVIFNIVKPAPTKFIESDDLKPGEIKCTESAHNGADAYFDYIVDYPEGSTSTPRQEVRFNSHYVPWQEVCLIGKTPSEENSPEDESDSEELVNDDILDFVE